MKRPTDWLSLILGASFMCLAILFFADQSSRIKLDLTLIGPILLIAFGAGSVINGIRRSKDADEQP